MTVKFKTDDLLGRLTPLQYTVTQEAATERPFTGIYWDNHEAGTYRCIVCNEVLFESSGKYDSHCGWPSFSDLPDKARVTTHRDIGLGMIRTEVRCANCGAHLGHLFNDGPKPTGLRYCINSASLNFEKSASE